MILISISIIGWVVSIMLTAGVSFQRLFDTYNRLYGAKDPVW